MAHIIHAIGPKGDILEIELWYDDVQVCVYGPRGGVKAWLCCDPVEFQNLLERVLEQMKGTGHDPSPIVDSGCPACSAPPAYLGCVNPECENFGGKIGLLPGYMQAAYENWKEE